MYLRKFLYLSIPNEFGPRPLTWKRIEVQMATAAQIFANRANSKSSTGPSTPEGKAASSQNAKTNGFNAADPVLPNEDRSEYNALVEQYTSEIKPVTTHEEFLVGQMTGARWKLNRLERIETAMFAALENPVEAFTNKDTAAGFARLDRYRASLERTYHRCARELRASRKIQNEANSTQTAEKKFHKFLESSLKRSLNGPPPGFFSEPAAPPA
jgi:hypothetical protein